MHSTKSTTNYLYVKVLYQTYEIAQKVILTVNFPLVPLSVSAASKALFSIMKYYYIHQAVSTLTLELVKFYDMENYLKIK